MTLKNAIQEKAEAQIALWEAELEKLRAEAANFSADQKLRYRSEIREMEQRAEAAQRQLEQLKKAGLDAWEENKQRAGRAFEHLKEAADRAANVFQK